MFSSTGFEAIYKLIGLELHERSIEIITSHAFFASLILFTFGVIFFLTAIKFFKRYMPGAVVSRSSVPLSKFGVIIFSLFLGLSLLQIKTNSSVKNYKQVTWSSNPYVTQKIPDVKHTYRVSFLFDLLSRTSEEVSRFFSHIVEGIMKSTNSELETPSFFYKAIMHASTQTIDDPQLKSLIGFYADQCFEKVLPFAEDKEMLSRFFAPIVTPFYEKALEDIKFETENGVKTCLDLKEEVNQSLSNYAYRHHTMTNAYGQVVNLGQFTATGYDNFTTSWLLIRELQNRSQNGMGVNKMADVPGFWGSLFQGLRRLKTADFWISLFGGQRGVGTAVDRAEKFGEHLGRAEHIKGWTQLILIAIFPWMIFFMALGRWKVIIYWFALFTSVSLWTPIWTLLYHIITHLSMAGDVIEQMGNLNDGISMYAAEVLQNKFYKSYSVYAIMQLILGPLPTVILAAKLSPLLHDTQEEQAPEEVNTATDIAVTVANPTSAGATKAVGVANQIRR